MRYRIFITIIVELGILLCFADHSKTLLQSECSHNLYKSHEDETDYDDNEDEENPASMNYYQGVLCDEFFLVLNEKGAFPYQEDLAKVGKAIADNLNYYETGGEYKILIFCEGKLVFSLEEYLSNLTESVVKAPLMSIWFALDLAQMLYPYENMKYGNVMEFRGFDEDGNKIVLLFDHNGLTVNSDQKPKKIIYSLMHERENFENSKPAVQVGEIENMDEICNKLKISSKDVSTILRKLDMRGIRFEYPLFDKDFNQMMLNGIEFKRVRKGRPVRGVGKDVVIQVYADKNYKNPEYGNEEWELIWEVTGDELDRIVATGN